MNRNYFNWIILLALGGLLLVGGFMWQDKQPVHLPNEIVTRPVSPFQHYISGVGIVEASSENVFIGSPTNRVVEAVEVKVGERVKKGQVLFRLEARDLEADLQSKHVAYEDALVNQQKLEALPRTEDLMSAAAALRTAEIEKKQAANQYERVEGLQDAGAMSQEEVMRRQFAFEESEARFQKAQSDFDKIKAGAWLPDLQISKLKVELAKAEMQRVETEIQRTIITSPIDATVLQLKIHKGEFPPADTSRNPPMIIGNTDIMHLRVNINQFDASSFNMKAPAVAYLQGNANVMFPLEFIRLEPFFVPKQNLTNDITEKVDTRVLQAVYAFQDGKVPVFVGQQMDVFIAIQGAP